MRLGFLGIFGSPGAKEGLRGGLMVTDDQGAPLEMQVATPVKPSRIQRAVYGESLARSVIVDLLAKPLLSALEYHPRLVLTNSRICLSAESRFPLILIRAADDMVVTGDYETKLLDASGNGSLMIAQQVGPTSMSLDEANVLLSRAREYFDALEVFGRIENAMDVLAEHDERFD